MQHTDYTHLQRVREFLTRCELPFETTGASAHRELIRAAQQQLNDYILPRAASLDNPLTVVVGGSTGAGKSTLVNSLLRQVLTRAGAIRPTTHQPVLLHHATDAPYLGTQTYLPTLARQPLEPGTLAENNLAGVGTDTLITVQTDALPPGIALIDAPDIDSISDANRKLAKDLLAAADMWLFVTTANRYADAVPWELLHRAAARNITVAVILNRVPVGDEEAIAADLNRMLTEAGITPSLLVSINEQDRDPNGLLPATALEPITKLLKKLGADAAARAAIARRTLAGAITGLGKDIASIEQELSTQRETFTFLQGCITDAYNEAQETIAGSISDGSLLRGEVLLRWQDFVGTGDFFRSVESGIGRLRDRLMNFMRARPTDAAKVEQALESGLQAIIVAAAARAEERVNRCWGSERAGIALREAAAATQSQETQYRNSEFSTRVAAQIRAWQAGILETIRAEGTGKRQRARILSLGVNAVAVLLMVAVFSTTGGLTGLEIGIAGGTGVVGTKILESVFGEETARRMARRARTDLLERTEKLLEFHRERFTAPLAAYTITIDSTEIGRTAEHLMAIGAELAGEAPDAKTAQKERG